MIGERKSVQDIWRVCVKNKVQGRQNEQRETVRMKLRSTRTLPVLRKVQPKIPVDEEELKELWIGLGRMGCAELLEVPWGVREEGLIHDLVETVPNTWNNTLTGHPEDWTLSV